MINFINFICKTRKRCNYSISVAQHLAELSKQQYFHGTQFGKKAEIMDGTLKQSRAAPFLIETRRTLLLFLVL
jgi:hypothetical protein